MHLAPNGVQWCVSNWRDILYLELQRAIEQDVQSEVLWMLWRTPTCACILHLQDLALCELPRGWEWCAGHRCPAFISCCSDKALGVHISRHYTSSHLHQAVGSTSITNCGSWGRVLYLKLHRWEMTKLKTELLFLLPVLVNQTATKKPSFLKRQTAPNWPLQDGNVLGGKVGSHCG